MKIYNQRHHSAPPRGGSAVYVGRPTKWGNPFKAGPAGATEACREYWRWIHHPDRVELLEACKTELRGRDLVCWCRPPEGFLGRVLCHAQVLAAIANGGRPQDYD